MVVGQARRTRSQQAQSTPTNEDSWDEENRQQSSSHAALYNDNASTEMDILVPVTDRSLLFPESSSSTTYMARSRSTPVDKRQPRQRRGSPSPSRASTFLRKLSSRLPKSPISPSFRALNPKHDHYGHLGGRDDEYEQDPVGVDLSSLAGLGFQLMKGPEISISQPSPSHQLEVHVQDEHNDQLPGRSTSLGRDLGDGMVVGARLRLDPSAAIVRAKSLRNLSSSASAANEVQRAKSIRDLAQDLASRSQQVIAVDDPIIPLVHPLPPSFSGAVDLSLLEGTERRFKATTSFDGIVPNAQSTVPSTQSYFYPEDRHPPNWKPWTMSSPFILLLILLSLSLAIIQEWLCRKSIGLKANDGILKFDRATDVSTWNFFCWKYLPTLIFVIYGVLWQVMDFEVKRLEPYYQLSQRSGSTAAESLNLDHLSLWSYLVPFKAFRLRQWAVFCSALGNLFTTVVCPSLQNPSVRFDENPHCSEHCPDDQSRFYVRIEPGWSRALTSFLVFTTFLAIILLVQLRRKSGLLSDPKGIAGIAAMATKSHILNDFQGMDLATHRKIHSKLRHRRYLLNKSSIWQGEYDKSKDSRYEGGRNLESPHPMMLRLIAGIPFISFLGFCLLAVPVINFTRARIIPNKAPWLPILIATLIKIVWTTFEFDVRMTEPFYILSKGNARPEMSLTLDYQGTVYGWFPIKALFNRHYIVALVGFSSILADILTVTVSAFSVNGAGFLHSDTGNNNTSSADETFQSFLGSVIFSIVILSFLILSAALVYALRRHPFLPRQPSTIAAVLAFIHASKMLNDFIDTERLNNKDMEKRLKEKGKRYGLGWFKGRDGQWHCAIDEEPMRSRYKHGSNYTMAQEPWHGGNAGVGGGGGYDFMRYDPYV
jgi:Protein of unknown function (DUF3433)